MRIRYSQIISLIRESVAAEYFGKGFIAFKKRVDAGESPLQVAEDMLQEIGKGSTRIVYGFSDNPGIVLKIINWNSETGINPKTGFDRQKMIDSNRWESDLQMQQKYPNVFPRTFEYSPDFSWIISEKVLPVESFDELLTIMGLQGEQFSKMPFMRKIQFEALIELAVSYFQEPGGAAQQMLSAGSTMVSEADETMVDAPRHDALRVADTVSIPKAVTPAGEKPRSSLTGTMERRLKKLVSNRQNAQIFAAMGDLKIPPREFSPKNLGVSEISGKLVLLDASLWMEYKPVSEGRKMNITRRQLKQIIREEMKVLSTSPGSIEIKGAEKEPEYIPEPRVEEPEEVSPEIEAAAEETKSGIGAGLKSTITSLALGVGEIFELFHSIKELESELDLLPLTSMNPEEGEGHIDMYELMAILVALNKSDIKAGYDKNGVAGVVDLVRVRAKNMMNNPEIMVPGSTILSLPDRASIKRTLTALGLNEVTNKMNITRSQLRQIIREIFPFQAMK